MRLPPKSLAPERLWRALIEIPHPQRQLKYRVREAEHIPLRVVALRSIEAEEALLCDDGPTALVAASVWATNERAFRGVDDVYALDEDEAMALTVQVLDALSVISPLYSRVDCQAWAAALEAGAAHPSNIATAARMATCVNVALGAGRRSRVGRPDRWYGMPIGQLTDGQLMAFDAARAVFEKDKE